MAGMTVLVVDDTILYRKLIADAVRTLDGVELVGTASSGELALARLTQSPVDVLLLDVHMPGLDGLETLTRIRRDHPRTEVVMISGGDRDTAATTMEALRLGAVEFIRKPQGGDVQVNQTQLASDLGRVLGMLRQRRQAPASISGVRRAVSLPSDPVPPVVIARNPPARFAVVAIGISTGGPQALGRVLPRLPADFPIPILVVQHMPPMFTEALANDLDRRSLLRVSEAHEGDPVRPGTILIAPGGSHLVVRPGPEGVVAALSDSPPENSCRPSVDVLFRSIAVHYGQAGVLSVIMTGMGVDGRRGVEALRRVQGWCLTQSAPTCTVYGMPQAVAAAGLSDEVHDLDALPERLTVLARRGRIGVLPTGSRPS